MFMSRGVGEPGILFPDSSTPRLSDSPSQFLDDYFPGMALNQASTISNPQTLMPHMHPVPARDVLIGAVARVAEAWQDPAHPPRAEAAEQTLHAPNRFTEEALAFAVNQQMSLLSPEAMAAWMAGRRAVAPCVVGVLNAGNIPMVGLQDFLAVVLMGHRYLGTVSSKSPVLLPAFVAALRQELPSLPARFAAIDDVWAQAEALIATGSEETRAWVEAQSTLHGIPAARCLLRGHRYAVAVIDGHETETERDGLAEDALLHEGLGCRNLAVVFAPKNLKPDPYLESFAAFRGVFPPHPDTPGALSMQQAFLEALDLPHAYGDGLEFLLSKGEPDVQGPAHLRWVEYDDIREVGGWLSRHQSDLQLVAARPALAAHLPPTLSLDSPGEAQRPPLDWHPDGIDTVAFLASL